MKIPSHLRIWASIHLNRLEGNMRKIRAALPPHLRYIAVVKADAYGHGLGAISTRLMRGKADAFAVANLDEAATLSGLGQGWPILVLSSILPAERPRLFDLDAIPIVSSLEEILALNTLASKRKKILPLQLKIDTGMGRAGCWHRDSKTLIEAIFGASHLKLHGVCTHFSRADSDPKFTRLQRERFLRAVRPLSPFPPDFWIHADNSAGIESFPTGGPFNSARIGLLQFGVDPHEGALLQSLGVEAVLQLQSRVILCKWLPAGTGISYGGTRKLNRRTRIAILAGGYGDGIPTSLSDKGSVLIQGQRCPILGRITMDQTIVDVTTLPSVEPGEIATWIGRDGDEIQRAETVAKQAGRIPWEIFTALTSRVTRLYPKES